MPQSLSNKQVFSLYEVARSIRRTLDKRYQGQYWVRAEMHKLNYYPRSGHCFPELLEKREGKVIAEISAVIWNQDYQRIARRFKIATNESLRDGIQVLMLVNITYDEVYGISLRIADIDPGFTLGVLHQERIASIEKLKKLGIFDCNRQLKFPLLPKRIAIISVSTSKGLADFYQILRENVWGYSFELTLFPALLQGERAITSIISRLNEIRTRLSEFDIVAIIRGGGADAGLASYNNADLASEIARFPIPVLTGIGHATNETVSELVAYKNAVTPTGLAEFLLQKFHEMSSVVVSAQQLLENIPFKMLALHLERLSDVIKRFNMGGKHILLQNREKLQSIEKEIGYFAKGTLDRKASELEKIASKTELLDPVSILKRGFGIVRVKEQIVTTSKQVNVGEEITVQLADGTLAASILNIENHG